jgi:hypothetical protein
LPTTEEARHQLHGRLDEVLGKDHATTLMEHLPPGGWANMATKADLDRLEERLDVCEERLTLKLEGVQYHLLAEMRRSQRNFAMAIAAANIALVAACIEAVRFVVPGS